MHLGHDHAGLGHRGGAAAKQWQTPHLADAHPLPPEEKGEPDLDLVEKAFAVAFPQAPDPTSFLRLAGVSFVGETAGGRRFSLLRVELNMTTDIGSLTPHLGGQSHRYDPLPAQMVSKRERLAFVYFDGAGTLDLTLAEAKALKNVTPDR